MRQGRVDGVAGASVSSGLLAWPRRLALLELSAQNLTWFAVLVGVILRVWEYLEFRTLYMDENALLTNLVGRAVLDFHHVLDQDQMAPPGFLLIERLMVQLPLGVRAAGRLFPLVCGLVSVFLMRSVARRYLDRLAVPIAVGLFALGDHLLYYSAEIKQYSCDLMLALAALLLAAPQPPATMSRSRLAVLALFGVTAPWFSFSVVFVLAGVGLHLIVTEFLQNDRKRAAIVTGMGLAWIISFGGCFLLSRSILSSRDFIWVWWNFAFLPLPPGSLADLTLLGQTLANVFINPGSILSPLPLPATAALASVLALLGCLSLARRWPGGLFLVISPVLFALAASGLRQYPFHGRLLLYLVPSFLLPLSEGVAAIGRRSSLLVTLTLAGLFIGGEAAEVAWHKAIQPRFRTFDSHGDLKNDLLDYLEFQRQSRSRNPRPDVTPRVPGTGTQP